MKTWEIQYLSYAGRVVYSKVETPDDASNNDAIKELYNSERGLYSSDDVFEVIQVTKV